MIPDQLVKVTVSNQGKYFASLGYSNFKQGDVLDINWKDLPTNSNKVVTAICDNCKTSFTRSIQLLNRQKVHNCQPCARKHVGKLNKGNQWGFTSDNLGENHPRWNPNKDSYLKYKADVARITRKQDLTLLENYDKPRGVCGTEGAYQLDHIVSIKYGYDNNIPAETIGNISNLQIIPWEENRTKSDKLLEEEN